MISSKGFVLALGVLASLQAYGISRVGSSSVGDPLLGFQVLIPRDLNFKAKLPRNGALLEGVPVLTPSFGGAPELVSPRVEIRDLSEEFVELADAGREELRTKLLVSASIRWIEITSPYSCALAMQAEGSGITQIVVSWGIGQGVFLLGSPREYTDKPIAEMLQSFEIDEDRCRWQ